MNFLLLRPSSLMVVWLYRIIKLCNIMYIACITLDLNVKIDPVVFISALFPHLYKTSLAQ